MTREVLVQLSDKVRTIVRGDGTLPDTLYDLLVTPTPHGHEANIHKFLPFMQEGWQGPKPTVDALGNIILDIGKPKIDFRTVFSCHMDTVHTDANAQLGLMYTLAADKPDDEGMVYAFSKYKNKEGVDMIVPSILGADDKIGMYIMLRLIENKTPGRYIFHVGEERGGIGSRHIASKTPEVLKGMRRAIAFDRANYTDTIAFQAGSRCSSTEFSTALANEINDNLSTRQLMFKPDVRGVWTDTANYVDLVSECCNISVGYFQQHGTQEHFDSVWLLDILLPALLKVDFEKLPTVRDKTKKEEPLYYSRRNYNSANEYGISDYGTNNYGGKVKMSELTKDTPLYRIPAWHPATGIPEELKPDALLRLCEGYFNENHYKHREVANVIATLVRSIDRLSKSNRELRRYLTKNGSPVFKNTSRKMNAIRRLLKAYDAAKQARLVKIDPDLCKDMQMVDVLANIDETTVDFHLLDDKLTDSFIQAETMQEDINALMENIIFAMYPLHASTPSVKTTYKNLLNVVKQHKDEPGITRLFKDKRHAS